MLTDSQIQTFKKTGVLLLRNYFDKNEIKIWHDEVKHYFKNPKTPKQWQQAVNNIKHGDFHLKSDPKPSTHVNLNMLYNQFYDIESWYGINELVITPPEPEISWLGARAPHVDFPIGCPERNLLNLTFYLDDVADYGGAFGYWPGSHHTVYDYFRSNPKDYLSRGTNSQDNTFSMIMKKINTEFIQFTGAAGDLLLWNNFIMHSATVNMSQKSRVAIIGRWGNFVKSSDNHFDFNDDIFNQWII